MDRHLALIPAVLVYIYVLLPPPEIYLFIYGIDFDHNLGQKVIYFAREETVHVPLFIVNRSATKKFRFKVRRYLCC